LKTQTRLRLKQCAFQNKLFFQYAVFHSIKVFSDTYLLSASPQTFGRGGCWTVLVIPSALL